MVSRLEGAGSRWHRSLLGEGTGDGEHRDDGKVSPEEHDEAADQIEEECVVGDGGHSASIVRRLAGEFVEKDRERVRRVTTHGGLPDPQLKGDG